MTIQFPDRQPVAHAADVAGGILPSRIDPLRSEASSLATGGGRPPIALAGTPSERARYLRLYGGPSLETMRDDTDTSVKLFAAIVILASGFGMYFAGDGYVAGIPLTCAAISIVCIGGLFAAASKRNRYQRRIENIEAVASAAVSAALAGAV